MERAGVYRRGSGPFSGWLALLLLSGAGAACSADAERQREIAVEVDEQTIVDLRLPAAEIEIVAASGPQLSARMTVHCRRGSSDCAAFAEALEFDLDVSASRVVVDTRPGTHEYGDATEVRVEVSVPRVRRLSVASAAGRVHVVGVEAESLHVDLTAGEVRIEKIDACPRVDLLAGEARVEVPGHLVAAVRLDAGVGEVTLIGPDGRRLGRRTWMVGSELKWDEGPGQCVVDVDVQAGAATVELTD